MTDCCIFSSFNFIAKDISTEIESLLPRSSSVPSGISTPVITNRCSKPDMEYQLRELTNPAEAKGFWTLAYICHRFAK